MSDEIEFVDPVSGRSGHAASILGEDRKPRASRPPSTRTIQSVPELAASGLLVCKPCHESALDWDFVWRRLRHCGCSDDGFREASQHRRDDVAAGFFQPLCPRRAGCDGYTSRASVRTQAIKGGKAENALRADGLCPKPVAGLWLKP